MAKGLCIPTLTKLKQPLISRMKGPLHHLEPICKESQLEVTLADKSDGWLAWQGKQGVPLLEDQYFLLLYSESGLLCWDVLFLSTSLIEKV